ncbi:hypothetical protein Y032_0001g429 [Ancylostoma ceylanicum]|uniref:Uncharacterized protein n=1 Tax=Ancylostoma ceylanicum TaxID=53326 RepID=A0A016W611_9BILA|nr:hypothetical protein Y032_0001g429 [Ancylostoma ceylanicum]
MGKALEDVNMLESSDEDEDVRHVNPVSQSESTFPDMTITAELGEIIEFLRKIVDVVKDTKARAESCEAGRNGNAAQEPALDAIKNGDDWTVLRARLEATCGDAMGKPARGNRRKYQRVVLSDQILVEILEDDHLGGRAKSVFLFLPVEVKRKGFEEVVRELGKLLAEDLVAGRMGAMAELRELKISPNQDAAEFCVALEKLGRKANPETSVQDRSLEFAQILLSNLKHWPEHLHLLSALHGVKPENAYEEVKQLAMTIEMSKKIYGTPESMKQVPRHDWRARSRYYDKNLPGEGRERREEAVWERDKVVERRE